MTYLCQWPSCKAAGCVDCNEAVPEGADALKELLARCKCGVFLTVNEHRDYYETPAQRLEWYAGLECPPDISDEVRAGILSSGTIVDLQFYPDTPIGSYKIVHHNLDEALRLALKSLTEA